MPMNGPVGATVTGVELAQPLAAEVRDEIWAALLRFGFLWFPQQALTPEQQAAFGEYFGELDSYPFVTPLAEHDKVVPIIKEPDNHLNFGGGWHTDTSYLQLPPKVTILQAVEVPDVGGDTLFADMSAAFEALSPGMQEMLQGLTGIFTADMVHGKAGAYAFGADHPMDYGDRDGVAERRVEHPVIRTHPETGRRSIYAGLAHCSHFRGMRREETRFILEWLERHATQAQFVTRLHWQSASVAMWDNRCLFHYALNDYQGSRRHMHRIILRGEAPA